MNAQKSFTETPCLTGEVRSNLTWHQCSSRNRYCTIYIYTLIQAQNEMLYYRNEDGGWRVGIQIRKTLGSIPKWGRVKNSFSSPSKSTLVQTLFVPVPPSQLLFRLVLVCVCVCVCGLLM